MARERLEKDAAGWGTILGWCAEQTCLPLAQDIASSLSGSGNFEADLVTGKHPGKSEYQPLYAEIHPGDWAAWRTNRENNTLVKAIGGARL